MNFPRKANAAMMVPTNGALQYSHKLSIIPDNNAGASARAGFIDAAEINAKNKISYPTIRRIATPLKPLSPFVYTT